MDACIADASTGIYGAVAGIKNIATPSLVALHLLKEQLEDKSDMKPCMLAGNGANDYAQNVCKAAYTEDITLVSPEALSEFQKYFIILINSLSRKIIANNCSLPRRKKRKLEKNDDEEESDYSDVLFIY